MVDDRVVRKNTVKKNDHLVILSSRIKPACISNKMTCCILKPNKLVEHLLLSQDDRASENDGEKVRGTDHWQGQNFKFKGIKH